MANPLPDNISGVEPFAQRKTLFLESPGVAGVLVIHTGKKMRQQAKTFRDAHAALDWCIREHAGLVFYFNADPSKN